jgi:uncharacterized protein YciI
LAYDRPEPGGPDRRQASRRPHFERMKPAITSGAILFAGSTLDAEGRMEASLLIVDFPDRAALDAWLADEPYVRNGVWGRIEVKPMFVAVDGRGITPAWDALMRGVPAA